MTESEFCSCPDFPRALSHECPKHSEVGEFSEATPPLARIYAGVAELYRLKLKPTKVLVGCDVWEELVAKTKNTPQYPVDYHLSIWCAQGEVQVHEDKGAPPQRILFAVEDPILGGKR